MERTVVLELAFWQINQDVKKMTEWTVKSFVTFNIIEETLRNETSDDFLSTYDLLQQILHY